MISEGPRSGMEGETTAVAERQSVPEGATVRRHHQAIDDIIGQMRQGRVHATLADGRQPILFHPLTNGGESMVFTGQRLPLEGLPHDVPYVLKIGLYAASEDDVRNHRERMKVMQRHLKPEWFVREHVRLHTCDDGEQRMVTMQSPVRLDDTLHLSCGYAETRTAWNQAEIGTVGPNGSGMAVADKAQTDAYTDRYVRVTRQLVLDCEEDGVRQAGREEFLETQRSKPLAQLLNATRRDAGLRNVMREFVERAIAYSNDTGEIVDILGEGDNVVLRREADGWTVRMLDPLHPCEKPLVNLRFALTMLSESGPHDDVRTYAITAINGLNYVRTMNGLARVLNIQKRLMKWRGQWNDDAMRALDLPNIMQRCRDDMRAEDDSGKRETPTGDEGVTCPREQLQILMRIA